MTQPLFDRDFCLIRHGETTANADHIIAGHLNAPLTQKGRSQARDLQGLNWDAPLRIFASPLDRARETAELAFPGQLVTLESGLMERNWGVFEGRPLDELPKREEIPDQGEAWDDFIDRVSKAIRACCRMSDGDYPVIVCHSGVIRVVRKLIGSEAWKNRAPNAYPLHFQKHDDIIIERSNDD